MRKSRRLNCTGSIAGSLCFFYILLCVVNGYQTTGTRIQKLPSAAAASLSSSSSSLEHMDALAAIALPSDNLVGSNESDDYYLPQSVSVLEKSYHGLVRENETLVEITPLIKVDEEKICNFRILNKPYHEIPFEIELINNLGILKAQRTLNCEKRKSYHFEIMAIFCDGTHSATANVHITVVDINEYAPIFLQPSYVTEVDEGRLYKEIIRVDATDRDCTPLFGDVCKYEIINNDQPFTIDNEGSIRNTEPLSHKMSHNHILSVVAFDCAMKESAPIMVSIKVRRVCEAKFVGIPERIDFTTNTKEKLTLFPNARLELCDLYCNDKPFVIHSSISLSTKHISFGCDRDMSNCSIAAGKPLIDLLPRNAQWTKNLSFDEGAESVYHFDGNSGVIVPDSVLNTVNHDFSTSPFSIVTIFRHSNVESRGSAISVTTNAKHLKEHILCSADDHKMNRHHLALFVRNCRLILLLRKNFNDGELNIFSPAEWRWKLPQVCDGEWHHYVLNVQPSSKIELFIDGVHFENSIGDHHNNPEVIDDWPLHAAHGVNTTLSVGACYQSSENRLKHGFNGDISEVKLSLNGGILTQDEVKCGNICAEFLLPPPERLLGPLSQVQTNAQMNEIYIEGQNKENVEQLLQHIQYVNFKANPTIGRRNIDVRTTIMCINQSTLRIPTVDTYIMVNAPSSTLMLTTASSAAASNPITLVSEAAGSVMNHEDNSNTNNYNNNNNKNNNNNHNNNNHNNNNHNNNNNNNNNNDDDNKGVAATSKKSMSVEFASNPDSETESEDLEHQIRVNVVGVSNNLVSYSEIKHGVHIFSAINMSVTNGNDQARSMSQQQQQQQFLDACSVLVFPSLNPDHEEIIVDGDEMLSSTLDIKTNINKDGVDMVGMDTIGNYLDVLRALVYSNKKPAYYLNRVFKLSCTELNAQFRNVEFTLTLTVLHPKQQASTVSTSSQVQSFSSSSSSSSSAPSSSQSMMMINNLAKNSMSSSGHLSAIAPNTMGGDMPATDNNNNNNINQNNKFYAHAMMHLNEVQEPKSRLHSIVHVAENSHPTMLVILVCVFLVILLAGVSIARLKNNYKISNSHHHQPCPKISEEGLVWDDSALTITINPMQSDAISEESSESENSDSEDEEVVKDGFISASQLEWDNTNMFSTTGN